MGAFAIGQVVVLPFPFSDLSSKKYRPALLLANSSKGDWIACQITSNAYSDSTAVELLDCDFKMGNLQRISYVRIGKLFTAHESLFTNVVGQLKNEKLQFIREKVIVLIRGN